LALMMMLALIALAEATVIADDGRQKVADRPNIVLIYMDDLGYADVRPFGEPKYPTPNLDRLAREGRAFKDFSVSSAVCSASRAALLTGCYHMRVGISGALGPKSKIGLAPRETTLAEICKSRGYATACVGKWHLGDDPKFMPLEQGFDHFYGLPYSNDMWPLHPSVAKLPQDASARKSAYPPLSLYADRNVIRAEITAEDQKHFTTDYTQRGVDFIQANREQPFFLYLAHSMVHVPLFVLPENKDKTGLGLFADVMSEVDWSVGRILDALDEAGVADNTLVIFTSDNGPWLSYGHHAGSAGALREGKGTSFEGGVRVPMIARWPGRIPSGTTCDEFAATIDVLPTVARLIDARLPDAPIDGLDVSDLLFSEKPGPSPHESYFIYFSQQLQAVRDRRWKLILPHKHQSLQGRAGGVDGSPAGYSQVEIGLSLFDLKSDPSESHNLAEAQPEVLARLQAQAAEARKMFGDQLMGEKGNAVRGPGKLE
jgi:arylsulfatase A-like enzyme